jgi:hypothetical protein
MPFSQYLVNGYSDTSIVFIRGSSWFRIHVRLKKRTQSFDYAQDMFIKMPAQDTRLKTEILKTKLVLWKGKRA